MSRRRFVASTAAASLSTLAIGAAPVKPAGAKSRSSWPAPTACGRLQKQWSWSRRGTTRWTRRSRGWRSSRPIPRTIRSGYGGLPNEDGVVELDAAVMHGPTHGGGSVASIRNIMHPAAVARLVMQRTRHCLLVGEGALRFARAHGFPEDQPADRRGAGRSGCTGRRPATPRTTGCRPRRDRRRLYSGVHDQARDRNDSLLGTRHPR